MSESTAIEKEAGEVVESACAQMIDCPCGCNREATANLFAVPDRDAKINRKENAMHKQTGTPGGIDGR